MAIASQSAMLWLGLLFFSQLASGATFGALSGDWNITVYYTAVESFHHKRGEVVRGCEESDCESKKNLGTFPSDFVKAVHDEGAGRITSGVYAGKYLCWSSDGGYWIDKLPSTALETALVPWVSAAADPSVMDYGKTFRLQNCGHDDSNGAEIDASVCSLLKAAEWKVMDRFEPGLGGKHHLDLYIGEEDQEDFVKTSPKIISVKDVTIIPTN